MPAHIEAEMIHVDDLPGIWAPVQWELTPEERIEEVETQARAGLLEAVDVPEAILRMLLAETDVEQVYEAPPGYDPELQGEWDDQIITFQFRRPIKLQNLERHPGLVHIEYDMNELGRWMIEIGEYSMKIERI
jgi:hypothetical protein